MPISHFSKVFGTEDAKIAKVTADPSGGSATYATLVDVPSIKSVEIGGSVNTVELRGDNTKQDSQSTLTDITAAIDHGKLSLDVVPVLFGGTSVDSGTTPNQKVAYDLTAADIMSYFKLEAKTPSNGSDFIGGDIHFLLHKLIASGFPGLGLAEENYRTSVINATAQPLLATGRKWLSIIFNETAAAIA